MLAFPVKGKRGQLKCDTSLSERKGGSAFPAKGRCFFIETRFEAVPQDSPSLSKVSWLPERARLYLLMLLFIMALISYVGTGLPVRSARALTSPSVTNWSRVVLSSGMVVEGEDLLGKVERWEKNK